MRRCNWSWCCRSSSHEGESTDLCRVTGTSCPEVPRTVRFFEGVDCNSNRNWFAFVVPVFGSLFYRAIPIVCSENYHSRRSRVSQLREAFYDCDQRQSHASEKRQQMNVIRLRENKKGPAVRQSIVHLHFVSFVGRTLHARLGRLIVLSWFFLFPLQEELQRTMPHGGHIIASMYIMYLYNLMSLETSQVLP